MASTSYDRRKAGLMLAGSLLAASFAPGCSNRAAAPDAGALRDAANTELDAPPLTPPLTGYARMRLVNMIPASPNLVVCLSTRTGTGVAETRGRILGSPDARLMSDGTLPFPAVSSYLPLPLYASEGQAYVVRLYDRGDVPFVMLGACPVVGAVAPVVALELAAADLEANRLYSAIAYGVLPGTPVTCGAGECPAPRMQLYPDDPTASGTGARVRLFQGIPNLPAPIHVCIDLDFRLEGGVPMNGPLPPIRALPEASDTNGVAFGEMSGFVDSPALTTAGAFYVHATVMGVPDCAPPTLLLGPIPVPLPVPATAPLEVARVIEVGDVITNFAFGRVGAPCTDDGACAATGGTCNTTRHLCEDVLSPSLLPWQDVQGMPGVDAGTPPSDAGTDAGAEEDAGSDAGPSDAGVDSAVDAD